MTDDVRPSAIQALFNKLAAAVGTLNKVLSAADARYQFEACVKENSVTVSRLRSLDEDLELEQVLEQDFDEEDFDFARIEGKHTYRGIFFDVSYRGKTQSGQTRDQAVDFFINALAKAVAKRDAEWIDSHRPEGLDDLSARVISAIADNPTAFFTRKALELIDRINIDLRNIHALYNFDLIPMSDSIVVYRTFRDIDSITDIATITPKENSTYDIALREPPREGEQKSRSETGNLETAIGHLESHIKKLIDPETHSRLITRCNWPATPELAGYLPTGSAPQPGSDPRCGL